MYLQITLTKEIDNTDQGQQLYNLVKQRLTDHPEVEVHGHMTENLPLEEPEPPPP